MASASALLSPRDPFPRLTFPRAGGGELSLPDELAGHFGVILFYRGSWCPYCNAQLAAFQRAEQQLAEVDARVVAASVDNEAATSQLVAKLRITFPVGHSANADAVAQVTGAFVDPAGGFLQSTGFVVDPAGRIIVSVYSSGAIGRLVPEDVIGLVRYVREHAAP
jgi:peroxiredoxin